MFQLCTFICDNYITHNRIILLVQLLIHLAVLTRWLWKAVNLPPVDRISKTRRILNLWMQKNDLYFMVEGPRTHISPLKTRSKTTGQALVKPNPIWLAWPVWSSYRDRTLELPRLQGRLVAGNQLFVWLIPRGDSQCLIFFWFGSIKNLNRKPWAVLRAKHLGNRRKWRYTPNGLLHKSDL